MIKKLALGVTIFILTLIGGLISFTVGSVATTALIGPETFNGVTRPSGHCMKMDNPKAADIALEPGTYLAITLDGERKFITWDQLVQLASQTEDSNRIHVGWVCRNA